MEEYPFHNAVALCHTLALPFVKRAQVLVDMTCGNGHDTLFLAENMGKQAFLYGFDIQASALASTQSRLETNRLFHERIQLKLGSHENLLNEIDKIPDFIVFNLGYLPGGNRTIHTDTAITLKAVDLGLHKISVNGIIMIVAYPGTPDGKKEKDELASFLSHVPQKRFDVSYWQPANQVHEPPVLFVIQKRG